MSLSRHHRTFTPGHLIALLLAVACVTGLALAIASAFH